VEHLCSFLTKFDSNMSLDEALIVGKENRYYLLNRQLKAASPDFFHAGIYLGKTKDGAFFPSFPLLTMMSKGDSNKVTVDAKTEWLFICGRDIFKRGIIEIKGSKRKGAYTLILNKNQECLGFGRILRNLDQEPDENQPTIRNVLDIGDFLRREQQPEPIQTRTHTRGQFISRHSGPGTESRKHYKEPH
jgi:ribosome biogenesis protein Nip4